MIDTSAHAATLENPLPKKKHVEQKFGRELHHAELRPQRRRNREAKNLAMGQAIDV